MSSEVESSAVWQEYYDEKFKKNYYYNEETGETTWNKPQAGKIIAGTLIPRKIKLNFFFFKKKIKLMNMKKKQKKKKKKKKKIIKM
jgi:hypothetical protein